MSDPIIADIQPVGVQVRAGTDVYWCSCGQSANQPFCDGSHAGTDFSPMKHTPTENGEIWLCACKRTGNAPFCDGSHSALDASLIGTDGSTTGDEPDDNAPADTASAHAGDMPVARVTAEEPTVAFIHELARDGLTKMGHHGPMASMGVPRSELPSWDDIQLMVAQMATKPLLDDAPVGTDLVIGPRADKPLHLDIPLFVSDMSFGALSAEAKIALATGAEMAGTGICSGEGGMLPEEQQANSRYFYELASAKFGYRDELLTQVQAFHFKGGQGAKTGTGGHLPAAKNVGKISEVRGLPEGTPAVSPATFSDLTTVDDYKRFSEHVRNVSGGIPIGMKLSANHIEADVNFALDVGVDYIILDGRGGGTGAAPTMFRDHISVPTIPALARARRAISQRGMSGDVTLIVTGGLRTHTDFVKAMALGAEGVAVSSSAMQAIGCVAARMCNTNMCPAGIATQDEQLRARIDVATSAERLARFFQASTELMQVLARACGHDHLNQFTRDDLATWDERMARLSGVRFAGVEPL